MQICCLGFACFLTKLLRYKLLLLVFLSDEEMILGLESNLSITFGIVTSFTLNNPFLKTETANKGMIYGLKGISMYSLMHGYTFLPVFVPPPREEHNWNRVRMTLQLFQSKEKSKVDCMYDWVVWMESDQVFIICSMIYPSLRNYVINKWNFQIPIHELNELSSSQITTLALSP